MPPRAFGAVEMIYMLMPDRLRAQGVKVPVVEERVVGHGEVAVHAVAHAVRLGQAVVQLVAVVQHRRHERHLGMGR